MPTSVTASHPVHHQVPTAPTSPPRARPVQYQAHHGTRWEKEKAAAGKAAFDFPDDPTSVGPWVIGECVGKGASGRVKVARHSLTGQLAAVKILPLEAIVGSQLSLHSKDIKSEKHRNGIDKEIIMMKLMDHPNIIRIYDVFEGEKELYLILEYVEGGELFDYLVNHGRMEPIKGLCYFKQIIYGLSYAHAFSIIHRDLKPENILIQSLNPPRVKLADWGMAAFAPPTHQLETSCGSPHYASPEIVNGKRYEGPATDIWSCGVILYALMTGRLPFDDKNMKILLGKVKSGKYEIPPYVHPEAADLIRRILVVDAQKRITMPEIIAHPFLQHATPGTIYVPAPSIMELARPIRSQAFVKPDILRSLQVIWGQATSEEMILGLTSPPGHGSLVKALYFLLVKYREKTLEEYGMSTMTIVDDESNIRHYAAPPPKTKTNTGSLDSATFPANPVAALHIRANRVAPTPPVSAQSPLLSPVSVHPEPSSPGRSTSSRQRPPSPIGPRAPGSGYLAKPAKSRPVSTPNASVVGTTAASPAALVPIPTRYRPRRAQTTVDGLPTLLRAPRDSQYDDNLARSSPYSPTLMSPAPLQMPPVLSPCSPRVEQMAKFGHATLAPVCLPWPLVEPLQPPHVGDPGLQRKMNDIAGRFNDLVQQTQAADAIANVNLDHQTHAPAQIYAEALRQIQPRDRGHSGSNIQTAVDEAGIDTENKENRHVRPKGGKSRSNTTSMVEPAKKLSMLGFRKENYPREIAKEAKVQHRKSRPPTMDMHQMKHSTALGLDSGNGLVSPAIVGSSLLPPPVGEFKGWFSNLFNWKAQQYILHSVDNCSTTREEAMRLLEHFGASVVLEDVQGWGVLRCKVDEAYDLITGAVAQKPVRFRVEFTPVLGYIQPATPRLSSTIVTATPGLASTPMLSNQTQPTNHYNLVRTSTKNMTPFASTLVLVQEKGALSTFKTVYHRLRAEWRLDALQSPDVGGMTPMMGPPAPRLSRGAAS